MVEKRAFPLTARSICGLTIILFGVLLTLDNLGLIYFDDFWQLWPVVLLMVGLSKLSSGEWARGILWLLLGAAFLLPVIFEEIEIEDLWHYWPLFLIAIGVSMVARSFQRPAGGDSAPRQRQPRASERPAPDSESSGEVQAFAFLSTVQRSVSTVFRRGDLTAVLGACNLDLTAAELPPEGAVLEIFAFWGGVELRIPDHWTVDPQLAVLMGAIEDKTHQRAATGGRLTIKGVALMGGFEIRN